MKRAPNPHSPEEVRRAIQNGKSTADEIQADLDIVEADVAVIESDVLALDVRIDALEAGEVFTVVADSTVARGNAVYITNAGHVDLAISTLAAKSKVAGLVSTGAASGFAATTTIDGSLSLVDWTAITGSQFLVPGNDYYLASTSGLLTNVAPTSVGTYVVKVGTAISTTALDIEIESPVLL